MLAANTKSIFRRSKATALFAVLCLLSIGHAIAQDQATPMPVVIEKDGRHALLVDGKPFLILGGQVHNSSAWPGMMPYVWRSIKKMHANTLEIPIYWEQVEPQPGKYDLSMIDTLLAQARKHQVRLVLLWFATWKNGSNHYMPQWMKRDTDKYPNVTGTNGKPVDSPSPHAKTTLDADIKAFTMVMRYLKKADACHTVIMVQVENEAGSWGSVRDHSAVAQKLFDGLVPLELLKPEVLKQLGLSVAIGSNWKEVFGSNADEYFNAWSIAKYIGQVAAAGKKEYPLPMYVNAALRDPLTNPSPATYESGGPTDNVIPIWKAAAPAIDLLAPDIYLSGSEKILKVLELYNRPDNALFVPEAGLSMGNSKYMYPTIAGGGIGFSPFGIDDNGPDPSDTVSAEHLMPYAREYQVMAPMMRELADLSFKGKIKAAVEREDHADQTVDLGAWEAIISFKNTQTSKMNSSATGRIMIIQLDTDQFMLVGSLCHITFQPSGSNSGKPWQYLQVAEGHYANGAFKLLRIRNGDETDWGGPSFGFLPTVLKASLVVR